MLAADNAKVDQSINVTEQKSDSRKDISETEIASSLIGIGEY